MFENEAKEKAKRKIYNFIVRDWGVSQIRTEQTCETVEGIPHFYQYSLEKMWQEGAEYGYKYKENEWHYIKNGDFPKNTKTVLALCIVGGEPYPYLAQYWKGSTTAEKNGVDLNWNCWLNNMQREVVEPYAWREITIPEFGLQGDCKKMTVEELEKATGKELIEERDYCGVDGYCGDYLDNVNAEMLKRFNRFAELEKENAELKEENTELKTKKIPQLERKIASIRGCHSVAVKKLNARIEQVERLKKENAELRQKLRSSYGM